MSEINQRFLPFCVLSENRGVPFTSDLEAATIFTLAELERSKGGGLILKQPEEIVAFIAKLSYPVWVSPWREIALSFDGLNQISYTQRYLSVPDVADFVENLKRSARTLETHQAFLSDHLNYFQVPPVENGLVVAGLMTDAQFIAEFNLFRRGAEGTETKAAGIGLIPPTLDESSVEAGIHDLETLRQKLQTNVDSLYRSIRFLSRTTQQYLKELQGKVRDVKGDFNLRIQQEEKVVAPKITQLQDDYDFRMNSMARSYEKRLIPIQQAKARLEKSREHTTARLERCKAEAKTHGDKGNTASEQKWRERGSEVRKELSEIEKQIKQIAKALKDLEETRSVETIRLRDELETKIRDARRNLLDLEAHRDAKILIYSQDMEKLEAQTKTICDQTSNAAKLLEANVAQLEKVGIERELGMSKSILYHIPFYVVCFQVASKKRFVIIPPSVVNNVGVFTKLKGALGMSKISKILAPRFKTVSSLTESIQVLAEKNAALEAEIVNLGTLNNILTAKKTVAANIKDGLRGLKDEGWLSDKEHDELLQRIA
jgi:hypothetical protein